MLPTQLSLFLLAVAPLACFATESCLPKWERDGEGDWLQKKDYDEKYFRIAYRKKHENEIPNSAPQNTADTGNPATDVPLPKTKHFNDSLEAGINRQINMELFAHYVYLSMAYHFDRDDIKMEGFHKFFLKMSEEEHEHAQMFMKYQNKRGGRIRIRKIKKPCNNGIWGNGASAMRSALDLEKEINDALIRLHKTGQSDPQFTDFLESNFLGEQVESIKQLSDYVNILERLNSPLGEYQFDKMTLSGKQS